jgi:hypothetical protein
MTHTIPQQEVILRCWTRYLTLLNSVEPELAGSYPRDLNITRNQMWFKEKYQNFVEEISEFAEHYHGQDRRYVERHHYAILDEACDLLHFAIDLGLIIGINPKDLEWPERIHIIPGYERMEHASFDQVGECFFYPIYHFGMCCNMLKNRPWKQSCYLVDKPLLHKRYIAGFFMLLYGFRKLLILPENLEEAHNRKIETLYFRFRTGY